ncbi:MULTISPECIES: UDP-glucose 4-epimerase GalE [unclassified Streptomyces]|uniref:UDP-glucose 4-epimerase GalE n=1 Tax=unclassified Streptomyces TaxID=2593676 RepID=UPI0023656BEA|nr:MULTISPECIES: UDP-glucose 4-epimerase GalE [unclassified Streptomyces]MDF3142165.1 UDP-glucose 4-epimerase GalE [Streptomyces sp. T21Q-yed]WDF43079.1 UDP-glucose 4-epimerase GalE [Streptomyces sp. T12]
MASRAAEGSEAPWAPSTVLVTGGAGFIGSHACVELLDHGYEVIVVDDYSNSTSQVFARMERIAGRFVGAVYELDIRDRHALSAVFDRHSVDAVVHFAAHKAAGRSTRMPIESYDINVGGTTALLGAMHEHGVHRLVYPSSYAVYGDAGRGPLDETTPARPTNPYAASKWICEQILADVCRRHPEYTVLCLRCPTTAGAHPSGLLGESPPAMPDHLMPHLAQVADGRRERLEVFGDDYPTRDGTAIRDYLHVMDAVEAHRVALDHFTDGPGMRVYNLGVGEGRSVLDVVAAFSRECGSPIPYDVGPRRPGDVAELVVDSTAVTRAWGWRPTRDLTDVCRDAWRFQRLNPHGYADSTWRPDLKE